MFLALNMSFPRLDGGHSYKANIEREMYRDLRIDHILSRLARQISAHCFVDHFFLKGLSYLPNQQSPISTETSKHVLVVFNEFEIWAFEIFGTFQLSFAFQSATKAFQSGHADEIKHSDPFTGFK